MRYDKVLTGTFIDRPNRFIAFCEITDPDTGQRVVSRCHVKNTGRSGKLHEDSEVQDTVLAIS